MRHDWSSRLFDVIEAHRTRAFEWGKNDCCLFVARCIDAMTDSQLESSLASRYSDEVSALQFIRDSGGLQSAVSSYLGEPAQGRATRGDVVLIDGGQGDAVGVSLGSKTIAMGPTGLMVLRTAVKAVWRV